MSQWFEQAFEKLMKKLEVTHARIGASYPHACLTSSYDNVKEEWWTNGFWPGMLWLAYRETKNENYAGIAKKIEAMLDCPLDGYDGLHHDVGFMWLLSAVAQYKINGNEQSRRRGLKAAAMLSSRFNLNGRFIRAWNVGYSEEPPISGWAIIDCMMNIPVLFWASRELNDPRYHQIACAHADTVLKEFIREDGSSHHIVCFDPNTGDRICALGGQGYGPDSAWSRGCSWAVYGMAMAYSYTGEERYLDGAKRAAGFFYNAMGESSVPVWDFCDPDGDKAPRDSSAGAIAACGMLELAKITGDETYRNWAERLLKGLYEHCFNDDPDYEGMILHATGNKESNYNVDVSLIYGDYYYMEGLLRLMGRERLF